MADRAARALELLRRNDSRETFVIVRLCTISDDELSVALQANGHVNEIRLIFDALPDNDSNWNSLLRVLATRTILEKVTLWDEDAVAQRNPPELVAPFLLAIQQNPNIQTVAFRNLQLSGDSVTTFIDAAASVRSFELWDCDMEAPGSALAVAAALQRNTNIRRLILCFLDDMYLLSILNILAFTTTVKELRVGCYGPSLDESLAVKTLLESTRTIQRFELYHDGDVHVDTFRPIAQGLIQSTSVTDVKFEGCRFNSHNKVHMLNNILASKSNLLSLALVNFSVHHPVQEEFRATIFSLLQPHSLLRSLELNARPFGTSQHFNRLLTAVETSPLEHFSIGNIESTDICETLIASIPNMQVENLELNLDGHLQGMKGHIIRAIKRNVSLRTVVAKVAYFNNRWFDDDDDKRKLMSYSARNTFLPEWIENPHVVPKAAWAEYLDVAQTTGPATVFHILRALAPSLGPFEGEQCQKRRRPDSPS
jgi:hypothetical protein